MIAASEPTTTEDTTTQMAYVAQQRLDGYAEMVAHAIKRKAVFNKRVLAHKPGEVSFSKGQLVQIYRSDLDHTFKTDQKLLPKWSPPQRVVERSLNSYKLEQLDGTPIAGNFSARRLRGFTPRDGTKLANEQAKLEQRMADENPSASDEEDTVQEGADISGRDEQPWDDEDSSEASQSAQQAARLPHERGAHGVGEAEVLSRDLSHDFTHDLVPSR